MPALLIRDGGFTRAVVHPHGHKQRAHPTGRRSGFSRESSFEKRGYASYFFAGALGEVGINATSSPASIRVNGSLNCLFTVT